MVEPIGPNYSAAAQEQRLKHIAKIDSLTPSPDDRAKRVLNFLLQAKSFSSWDLICFSAHFLTYTGSHFLNEENADSTKLKEAFATLNELIVINHYFGSDWETNNSPIEGG